jgi:hypothetical protein
MVYSMCFGVKIPFSKHRQTEKVVSTDSREGRVRGGVED